MYCQKCGKENIDGSKFCSSCGETLIVTEKQVDLVDTYIGNNAEQIKNSNFSWLTFLFGGLYLAYRKLFGLAIAFIIVNITLVGLLEFLNPGAMLEWGIRVVFYAVCGLQFKRVYLNKVNKEINKIKNNNQEKTDNELIGMVSSKGGTSVGYIFGVLGIALLILAISTPILMYIVTPSYMQDLETHTIEELEYKIPDSFEQTKETSNQVQYEYVVGEDDLNIAISINTATDSYYYTFEDQIEYLEDNSKEEFDTVSELKSVDVNGDKWYYLECTYTEDDMKSYIYYYLIEGDDYNYIVSIVIGSKEEVNETKISNIIINNLDLK